MSKAPNHVMIDLETMGVAAGSAIVSIGAVVFDPRYGVITDDTYCAELDWRNQGRERDKSTELWWKKQSPNAKAALKGTVSLDDALMDLAFFMPADAKVWANGPSFDIAMLEDAYRKAGEEIPWKFWNARCCRTIKDMYESQRGGLEKGLMGSAGVKHNALDDAIAQAQVVNTMWARLLGGA